jgi:hypothetical protein
MKKYRIVCDFGDCPNHTCWPMTNEEILKKAIEKAVKNGFKFEDLAQDLLSFQNGYIENVSWNGDLYPTDLGRGYQANLYPLIFSHSFAKAFWGEKHYREEGIVEFIVNNRGDFIPEWKHHLQQMVIEEEPLKYLEKFLEK